MSGVAVGGSLASSAGEPGPCLGWFRCQLPVLSLGWPSVGPWLPWPGARPMSGVAVGGSLASLAGGPSAGPQKETRALQPCSRGGHV